MIALQVAEPAEVVQLVNLLQILVAVAIIVAVAIVALSLLTSPRIVKGLERAEVPGAQVLEEADTEPTSAIVDKYEAEVLRYLSKFESVEIQDLLSQLPGSREYLAAAVSKLVKSGLVEVSGGVLLLTENGRKVIELLKEKQWLENLEQTQE